MSELHPVTGSAEVFRPDQLDLLPDGQLTPAQERALALAIARHYLAQGKRGGMILWGSDAARAWVYRGEWVADCPRSPDCGNVEYLTDKPQQYRHRSVEVVGDRKDVYHCSNCDLVTPLIDWPPDTELIMAALNRRPVPDNRNWWPAGHLVAVNHRRPHGQSVAELLAENKAAGLD